MEMLAKMAEVLVKIVVMMVAPGGTPVPLEARGREPPPSSSSLTSSLDGRRVSPLVLGVHGMGGARAPPRLDLSLCFLMFLCVPDSGLSLFLIFPEIYNSDWAEILTQFLSGYWLSCGERRAPTALWGVHEGQGRAPYLVAPSGIVSC